MGAPLTGSAALPALPDAARGFLAEARDAYVQANAATLRWMLARPRRHGAFLDTKVNSLTLADYTDEDSWRSPRFLHGWIQGRGLEAVVAHARFFGSSDPDLAEGLHAAGRALFHALAALQARDGHLYFCYDPHLRPVRPGPDGQVLPQVSAGDLYTYSDAFALKGLAAAAAAYAPAELPHYLDGIAKLVQATEQGRFVMDEAGALDASALAAQEDEFGPRMIVLGAASLLKRLGYAHQTGFGARFIRHVLDRHRDSAGLLHDVPGEDRCNPGHAIELAGFAYEYLSSAEDGIVLAEIERVLLASARAGLHGPGVCLRISARTRQPISPYYPWWPLPELVRAAAWAYAHNRNDEVLALWRRAHEAFFTRYWRRDLPIAYQTRTLAGPVDYVPATPDLDPAYHTGLSFLGAIEAIDRTLT